MEKGQAILNEKLVGIQNQTSPTFSLNVDSIFLMVQVKQGTCWLL